MYLKRAAALCASIVVAAAVGLPAAARDGDRPGDLMAWSTTSPGPYLIGLPADLILPDGGEAKFKLNLDATVSTPTNYGTKPEMSAFN